jgi:pimeloyl-[acyl-carrier protein] methyl ester esterase
MIKIHQETIGTGMPIVMVHGWAMQSAIWRKFADELSKSYRVTLVDLPGHGQSEKLADFTLSSISEALLNSVVEEPSCWLGWSLGAAVVLHIAQQFPERCQSLILVCGNPHFVRTDRWPGIHLPVLNAFATNLQTNGQATLLRFLSLQINGLPEYKTVAKAIKSAVSQFPAPDQGTLMQGLQILKETDLRPALANLTIPVSAIFGSYDTLVPSEVAVKMQEILPTLQVNIIERAGHVPFLSHQQDLLAIIDRFMDER